MKLEIDAVEVGLRMKVAQMKYAKYLLSSKYLVVSRVSWSMGWAAGSEASEASETSPAASADASRAGPPKRGVAGGDGSKYSYIVSMHARYMATYSRNIEPTWHGCYEKLLGPTHSTGIVILHPTWQLRLLAFSKLHGAYHVCSDVLAYIFQSAYEAISRPLHLALQTCAPCMFTAAHAEREDARLRDYFTTRPVASPRRVFVAGASRREAEATTRPITAMRRAHPHATWLL